MNNERKEAIEFAIEQTIDRVEKHTDFIKKSVQFSDGKDCDLKSAFHWSCVLEAESERLRHLIASLKE